MQFTQDDRRMIQESHDLMLELRTMLVGKDGQDGLCKRVDSHAKRIRTIEIMLAFAAGGGGLAAGVIHLTGG